jgi:siroheme synthase-like protein
VTLDLTGEGVLVVGAGAVALRKLRGLPRGVGPVRVVAPEAAPGVRAWIRGRRAEFLERPFRPSDVAGARLVFCCASDPAVNARAAKAARRRGAWVCDASETGGGDFAVPATLRAGGLHLTLSTEGASPAAAAALKKLFAARLEASDLQWLLAELGRLRPALKASPARKAALLERLEHAHAFEAALKPRTPARRERLRRLLRP